MQRVKQSILGYIYHMKINERASHSTEVICPFKSHISPSFKPLFRTVWVVRKTVLDTPLGPMLFSILDHISTFLITIYNACNFSNFNTSLINPRTVWAVWKTVLEETRRVGEMRLQAADTYLQQISEPAKPLKTNKQQVAKKVRGVYRVIFVNLFGL